MPIESGRDRSLLTPEGHLSEEGVSLYVDALRLNKIDELPSRLVSHVTECVRCKGEVLDSAELLADQPAGEAKSHPYFGRRKWNVIAPIPAVVRIAAAVVIMLAVASVFYFWNTERPNSTMERAARPTTPVTPPPAQKTLAENYEPSPTFEGMVGAEYRSGDVEVLAPAIGAQIKGSLLIRWKGTAGSKTTITVLTNRGAQIATVTTGSEETRLVRSFDPGLYYWKLENEGAVVYVGKFIVR